MSEDIRLLIVEDHHIVRMGLVALLGAVGGISVVAEASDGEQGVALFREHKPDVVLMDLRMPGMTGVEAITQIRSEFAEARNILLTTFDGDEDIYKAMQAGARGYLLKGMSAEELVAAIQKVHAGQFSIPPLVTERLAGRLRGSGLTARELDILKLIVVTGKNNRDIGACLSISEATVKTHLNNLFSKLGVDGRTQAAMAALQRGIVHLP